MSAAVCVFILTVYTLSGASGLPSRPSHVRLTSYNMDLVLRWDPPAGAPGGLLYTAQYGSVGQEWRSVCVNTSLHECDLSNSSLTVFGRYRGRVQTQSGEERSAWGESELFSLDKETLIGPPSVSLVSNGDNMEVSITDPEFSISSLKKAYTHPTYNITYWRDGQKEKAKSITRILQNRVVLDELDLWTNYCVKVQIHTERNLNPSRASMTVCESTTKREEAPWVAAVVTFVVMVVAAAVVGVAVVHHRRISHFLCPKVSLPHYFEDLQAPPNSMYRAMQDSQTTEEICHPFSVIADNGAVEEERPLQADRALEEERPLQADRAVEEERPLQADRAVEEERPLQADRSVEEERPLQADRAVEEERPQQADRAVEEERPQQADRAMEEARPLQAVRSSCSTEPDVTEGEGQGQIEEGNVTQVQPNQSQITL